MRGENDVDVTAMVGYRVISDEDIILCRCVCGRELELFVGVHRDDPDKCPQCGREFYTRIKATVMEVRNG
jgi:hypothetical protein